MRKRALTVLAHSARGLGLSVVFIGAVVGAVVLHSDLPGFRRAAAQIGNQVMASVFEGRIDLSEVETLTIGSKSRVRIKSATAFDTDGTKVVHADGLEATINLRSLLASIFAGRGPVVELENVSIENADVLLDWGPDGNPTIAHALHPRVTTTAPTTNKPTSEPTPRSEPYLDIADARLGHAHVHGNLVPPTLDGTTDAVRARVHLEHEVIRIDLDEGQASLLSPHAPNQNQPIAGAVKGTLSVTLATVTLSGHADLVGSVGTVPLVAHAQMDGDVVDATVDVARIDVDPLSKAFAGLPFGRPVEVHGHAHGTLPNIALDVRGRVGESDISAKGELDLRAGHAFTLDGDALHVDASAYGAPVATDITTKIHAEGTVGGHRLGVLGTYKVTTKEGTVGKEGIPAATVEGTIEEKQITASITASEPGIALTGTGSVDLATFITNFDVHARSASIRSITRLPNRVDGSASVRVQGKVNILARTIQATTTIRGDGVSFDAFSAAHIDANGQLHGPIDAPILDLGFTSKNMQVKAKDKTPLLYPSASGRARIAFVPNVSIVSLSIDLGDKGSPNAMGASAANIRIVNGVVEARGVELTGLGEPLTLDATFGAGSFSIRAKSAGVDLHRVAVMTGIKELEVLPEGTKAAVDVDVHDSDSGATGHIDLVVKSEPGKLLAGGIVLEAHAKIDRGHVAATAKMSSEGLGAVELSNIDLHIPGRLDARSLERMTGTVEVRGAIDLAQGGALLGGESIEQMSGIASFEGRVERGDPDALPAIRATVKTKGLDVTYSEDPKKPSIRVAGIDLLGHLDWDGRTDDTEIALLSWDRKGLLTNATANAKVPLLDWATGAKRITRRAIADLEVNAVADVPSRKVADLPALLDLPALRGKVSAHASLTGQVVHPNVVVSATADGLRTENPTPAQAGPPGATNFRPLDAVLEARWDGERGAITFAFDERAPAHPTPDPQPNARSADPTLTTLRRTKRAPGHLRGLVLVTDARMSDLLRGRAPKDLPWSASSEIEVQDLNLAALPIPNTAYTRRLTGALSGRFSIRDLNRAASGEAKATIEDFGIGGAQVESVTVTAGGRDGSLFVNAQVKDSNSSATLQLASQSLHIDGTSVSWDDTKPSRLDYAVQNARLGLLLPIVRRSISELDGRINGTGSITLDGKDQVFEGGLALTQTTMYVNQLGEQISGLNAIARFERSGSFTIEDASGKLGAGEFHAKARGVMKGFAFASADATLTASKEGIPISSEGANFASAAGEVNVSAKMSADRSTLEVKLTVPRADVTLPDRGTQQLQAMEPDKTIAVGLRKKGGALDTAAVRRGRGGTGRQQSRAASTAFTTMIDASLGDKVHLEGRGLDITLGGRTYIQLANEVSITGQIDLRAGTIEVHGRRFTVDHGVVTFAVGGDPGNPSVVAAAYWDAPDRTRVWVEFAGPLKTGTLSLRSEPAYSKNEILSILLFGQPDPNAAAGTGGTNTGDASGATAVGSGFVAEDVNRMLSEIDENLDVETDTLSGNRARTKLGRTFFDRRLKVQLGYAPGQTYREPDTTYLFLNWQFIPKWSIVGTRGDKGTSILDVLFQHRY